jgi:bacillithiol biosynthesis deacetylase BshB1
VKLDILAIGAHPDDVELGAGGFLLRMKALGYTTGIVDLTRGELGSRGTPEIRAQEAEAAARILGVKVRRNLDLGDGRLEVSLDNRHALARAIRELKPSFLVGPYFDDKHPDHAAAGGLMKDAFYDARMPKLKLGVPPHSCRRLFYYPCHIYVHPSLVVDISPYFEQKMEAVRAYESQFGESQGQINLDYYHIGISDYIFHMECRCGHFGSLVGVSYGEGFYSQDPLLVNDPHDLLPAGRKLA